VTKPEKSVTAYKTWDTVLKCNIFGYPTPEVYWAKSHGKLPVDRHVISGNTLTIKNVTEEDEGVYTCWAIQQLNRDDYYFSPVAIVIHVEEEGRLRILKVEMTTTAECRVFFSSYQNIRSSRCGFE